MDSNSINTYSDLANPKFQGKVCLRKRNNVYNQSLVADQIITQGERNAKSWLKGMIANIEKPFFSGDVSLIRSVARGECGIGVVNHYYFARMQAGKSGIRDKLLSENVKLIMPNPAHVNISAAGLATSATNKAEAIELIEYLASKEGSAALSGPTFEYPIKENGDSKQLQDFGPVTPDNVSISDLGNTQKRALEIMANSGWN